MQTAIPTIPSVPLIALALLATVILLILRGGRSAWLAVGLIILFLPLLAVGSYLSLAVEKPPIATLLDPPAADELASATIPSADPSPAWLNADEYFLKADVYPSPESATRGAAAGAYDRMAEAAPDFEPSMVRIRSGSDLDQSILGAAVEGVRRRNPEVSMSYVNATGSARSARRAQGEVLIWIEVTDRFDRSRGEVGRQTSGGRISAEITWPGDHRIRHATRYLDKPWVENFSAFTNASPQRQWALAQSIEPALSHREAMEQATQNAAAQVINHLDHFMTPPPDSRLIYQQLESGNLIADRFTQKFDRPSGDVHRMLLLIDASSENLSRLAAEHEQQARRMMTTRFSMLGSVAGLLALVIGLYLYLNAATKGYYVAALRLGVAVAAAAGFAAVVMLWK